MPEAKPYASSKQVVWKAYKEVRPTTARRGVDGQSIEAFEAGLKGNLSALESHAPQGDPIHRRSGAAHPARRRPSSSYLNGCR